MFLKWKHINNKNKIEHLVCDESRRLFCFAFCAHIYQSNIIFKLNDEKSKWIFSIFLQIYLPISNRAFTVIKH